jgi:hypothetical protein
MTHTIEHVSTPMTVRQARELLPVARSIPDPMVIAACVAVIHGWQRGRYRTRDLDAVKAIVREFYDGVIREQ